MENYESDLLQTYEESWETLNEDMIFVKEDPPPETKTRAVTYAVPTEVDIGNLVSGGSVTINPIWVWKWNSTQHYEQDAITGNIRGAANHTFELIGTSTCEPSTPVAYNKCTYSNCGYTASVARPDHTPETGSYGYRSQDARHFKVCTVCNEWVETHWYSPATHGYTGKCTICGQTETVPTYHAQLYNGDCQICNLKYRPSVLNFDNTNYSPTAGGYLLVTMDKFAGVVPNNIYLQAHGSSQGVVPTLSSWSTHSTTANDVTCRLNVSALTDKAWQSSGGMYVRIDFSGIAAGNSASLHHAINLPYDKTPPTHNTSTVAYSNIVNGWATKATITTTFTEAWANLMTVALYDGATEIRGYGSTTDNGNGTFTGKIDVVAEALTAGKTFQVRGKDRVGNIGTGNVTLAKVDSKSPVWSALPDAQSTWAKTKTITLTTTDAGIGDVSMALGVESDYAKASVSGSTFTRQYTLKGDVYSVVNVPLYAKDGLSNAGSTTLPVNRLDNTRPTVASVTRESTVNPTSRKYTVNANDNHPTKGAGSGVTQYAMTTSNVEPTSGWQASNQFNVTRKGIYYFWAKDLVGNVSLVNTQTETDINPIVTFPSSMTLTYGSSLSEAVRAGQSNTTAGQFSITNASLKPTVAQSGSTQEVVFTPTDTTGYNTVKKNVNIVVNRKAVTVAGLKVYDKVYDGSPTASIDVSGYSITGNLDSSNLVINTSNATALANSSRVGTRTVTFSGVALSGSAANNYTLSSQPPTVQINITKRQLQASTPEVKPYKVYDGTPDAIVEAGDLLNPIPSDNIDLVVVDAKYNSTNTRSASMITVTYGLQGADSSNYIAPVVETFSGKIIKDEPDVTWPTLDPITYGQSLAEIDLSSGVGDGYFTWSIPGYKPTVLESGTKIQLTFYPNDDENYLTLTKMLEIIVLPREISVNGISATDKVYDGNTSVALDTSSVSITGNIDGENLKLVTSNAAGSFSDKTVSVNKLVSISGLQLTGTASNNYILAPVTNVKASITPMLLEVSIPDVTTEKEYDGTTTASVEIGELLNVVDGDDVILIAEAHYNDSTVGSATTITVTYTLSGADSSNYVI